MLAQLLLVALMQRATTVYAPTPEIARRRKDSAVDVGELSKQNSCRTWQFVPSEQRRAKAGAAHRRKMCYHLSLLQVATGSYNTYTSFEHADQTTDATDIFNGESTETALVVHPVFGRRHELVDCMTAEHLGAASKDVTIAETYADISRPISPPQSPLYKAAAHTPLVQSSPGRFLTFFPPNYELSTHDVAILSTDEKDFTSLMSHLEPSDAALVSVVDFGCSLNTVFQEDPHAQVAEYIRFPLEFYRAIETGKDEYFIDGFDPSSLVNGALKSHTCEAAFMDELPVELQGLFITYLQHLTSHWCRNIARQPHKAELRMRRTEAEFEDARFLWALLLREEPDSPVPFGQNPMVAEYWARRDLDYRRMKEEYFYKQAKHAHKQAGEWLSIEEEEEVNLYRYFHFDEPLSEPWEFDIPEMQELPVEFTDKHPVVVGKKAFTRAYEAWEPEVVSGEEKFPDCPEGDAARECLENYQCEDYPPEFLEWKR
ncbi:hypothetical protein CC86DRAFT_402605 [Ophiobolus disseminans]|uniref:Uncharacterized protein n=1 Tax=Ophiobolus disseminans TaxID=1469910 RepID=A0A6A7ABQ7_9PLEO|nr:hypothetical protein CC86DRAFT_402605 [Ophiobolus disseminans]